METINMVLTLQGSFGDMAKVMVIPILPEEITISRPSQSETANVVGIGDINIPQVEGLMSLQISSIFQKSIIEEMIQGYRTPKAYADWFKTWRRSRLPCRWVVSYFGYDLLVTIQDFQDTVRAGEVDDIYYTLSLLEYRPYGSQIVIAKTYSATGETTAEPQVPQRVDNKPQTPQIYTVQSGDNLTSIAIKLSPGGRGTALEIYNIPENKSVIGNNINLILPGQQLIIPESWR